MEIAEAFLARSHEPDINVKKAPVPLKLFLFIFILNLLAILYNLLFVTS